MGAAGAEAVPPGSGRIRSPVAGVQVLQALVARELVEGFGLPERRAARLLGLAPSAVSQYRSGKRLGPRLASYLADERARRIAREAAQRLVADPDGPALLEAAIALHAWEAAPRGGPRPSAASPSSGPPARPQDPRWLRRRIVGEQNAVAECMRLAQRSRDELTRALFRQIAADSLRHAEIVAAVAGYLDRGVTAPPPTGITRADLERLLAREHAAEARPDEDPSEGLGGVMRVLWDSMEADERKHELLIERLLATLPAAPPTRRRQSAVRAR